MRKSEGSLDYSGVVVGAIIPCALVLQPPGRRHVLVSKGI
jgi:hypothetical protein